MPGRSSSSALERSWMRRKFGRCGALVTDMRANRLLAGLLVLSGAWLLGTSAASAAVVSFEETGTLHRDPTGEGCSRYGMCDQRSSTAKLEAAAGEQNTVSVEASGGGLLFRDVATPLLAGPGCEPAAGGTVRCPRPKGTVTVLLGDGDDVAMTAVRAHVDGGPGTDEIALLGGGTVTAGDGDDLAWGGDARVGLDGQGGDDVLL